MTENNSNDHSINTQDTSHDDGNEGLHNNCWSPDWNTADTSSCFGSSVGSSEILNVWKRYWQGPRPYWLPWSRRMMNRLWNRQFEKRVTCYYFDGFLKSLGMIFCLIIIYQSTKNTKYQILNSLNIISKPFVFL